MLNVINNIVYLWTWMGLSASVIKAVRDKCKSLICNKTYSGLVWGQGIKAHLRCTLLDYFYCCATSYYFTSPYCFYLTPATTKAWMILDFWSWYKYVFKSFKKSNSWISSNVLVLFNRNWKTKISFYVTWCLTFTAFVVQMCNMDKFEK